MAIITADTKRIIAIEAKVKEINDQLDKIDAKLNEHDKIFDKIGELVAVIQKLIEKRK